MSNSISRVAAILVATVILIAGFVSPAAAVSQVKTCVTNGYTETFVLAYHYGTNGVRVDSIYADQTSPNGTLVNGMDYNFALYSTGTVVWSTGHHATTGSTISFAPNALVNPPHGGRFEAYAGKDGDGVAMCGVEFFFFD